MGRTPLAAHRFARRRREAVPVLELQPPPPELCVPKVEKLTETFSDKKMKTTKTGGRTHCQSIIADVFIFLSVNFSVITPPLAHVVDQLGIPRNPSSPFFFQHSSVDFPCEAGPPMLQWHDPSW